MKNKTLIIILSVVAVVSLIFGIIGLTLFFEMKDKAEDLIENKIEQEMIMEENEQLIDEADNMPVKEDKPEKIEEKISEEDALMVALTDANLNKNEIKNVYTHLEYDDGIYQYEVKFYKDTKEYEYNIDAKTGNILERDMDYIFD